MPNNLRPDARLSRKFSEIAGTEVQVYFNNRTKFYELYYKGRQIVGLLDMGITTGSQRMVREHFKKLRYGVQFKEYHKSLTSDPWKKKDEQDEEEVENYWYESRHELERAARNPITISG